MRGNNHGAYFGPYDDRQVMMTAIKVFEIKDLEYIYPGGVLALAGINLDIEKGRRIVLMGANGSGKSTLLAMLDGLIFPTKGSINFLGRDLSEKALTDGDFAKEFRLKTGFVFQNPDVQLFCPTVREDIAFGPLCMGVSSQEAEKRVNEIAADLNLTSLLDRPPHRLSLGEKKKVAIASVLISNPEVLIMDEPTAGLDPLTTRHIIDLLVKAGKDGRTVITATHDLHIVEEIADTVYILGRDKKIAASGPPETILGDDALLKENNLVHLHSHTHNHNIPHTHPHAHGNENSSYLMNK